LLCIPVTSAFSIGTNSDQALRPLTRPIAGIEVSADIRPRGLKQCPKHR
jgi:hypothetical protein